MTLVIDKSRELEITGQLPLKVFPKYHQMNATCFRAFSLQNLSDDDSIDDDIPLAPIRVKPPGSKTLLQRVGQKSVKKFKLMQMRRTSGLPSSSNRTK